MMDDRDPLLQSLFDEARRDLDGEAFIAKVMAKSRFLRYRVVAPWICVGLMLAAGAWYLAIPLEVAQLMAQVLTTTLVDLGDGWLAWAFSPVNNIAALLVLIVKAIRIARKKIIGTSYAF
jgi:hypothetical protein